MITRDEILALLQEALSPKRLNHTMQVERLAVELADIYNVDADVSTAALLHDITKEQNNEIQLQLIKSSDIILNEIELNNHKLYHSITAYLYSRDVLKIKDIDILNAIRYHTTGRANMSIVEKIIYVADTASYDRNYSEAEDVRKIAFKDLDKAALSAVMYVIGDLMKRQLVIGVNTLDFYNNLVLACKK